MKTLQEIRNEFERGLREKIKKEKEEIEKIKKKLYNIDWRYQIENYFQIDLSKSNVPIYIFQTKLKNKVLCSYVKYDIFVITKINEEYQIKEFFSDVRKYSKMKLKRKFNKYLEFFSKNKKIKKFFYFENYTRKEFVHMLDNNKIPNLSWIRARNLFYYRDAIFLKNQKIAYVKGDISEEFCQKGKIKKENFKKFLCNSKNFQIKKNIFKFSETFKKKRIQKIMREKNYWNFNIITNNCQHYVSKTLGFEKESEDVKNYFSVKLK